MAISSQVLYYIPTTGGITTSAGATGDAKESTVNTQSTTNYIFSNVNPTVTTGGITVSTNLPVDLNRESAVNTQSTTAYASIKTQIANVSQGGVTVLTTPLSATSNTSDTLQKVQIWNIS